MAKKTLIFGCGYVGRRVARRRLEAGNRVWGVTRGGRHASQLSSAGITPIIADWNDRRTLGALPAVDEIVVAVGYDRRSKRSIREVYVDGLRNALAATAPHVRLVYCSSTGVFHQEGHLWVDETSPTHPLREGGKAHLAAEELLARQRPEGNYTILRLAGIYGPGRVPRATEIAAGRPLPAPLDGYLNLIHAEDAAASVVAALDHPTPQRCYLVSDGTPVLRRRYYEEIARLLRAPAPVFTAPDPHSPAARRAQSSKRIWNARMRRDLLPHLRFPDYRSGLQSILHTGR